MHQLDVRFHGSARRLRGQPHPPPGPLGARFRALGGLELGPGRLVAGPWGDCSSDLHILLKQFAELRCAAMCRAQGWEGGAEGLLGKVMGEVRHCGQGPGYLLAGEAVSAGSWGTDCCPASTGVPEVGGEEEEREASICACPRAARSGPHWEGLCALNCSSH